MVLVMWVVAFGCAMVACLSGVILPDDWFLPTWTAFIVVAVLATAAVAVRG